MWGVIFASEEPVAPREIAEAFGGLDEEAVELAIRRLADGHAGSESGLRIERVAGGYRLPKGDRKRQRAN